MVSSDPRLLAAGDVAFAVNATAGRRLRVEHWGEALNMGEVAGRTIAGRGGALGRRARLLVGDRRAHAQVRRLGRRLGRGPLRVRERGRASSPAYGRDGELVGVLAHDDDAAYEEGKKAIEERARWQLSERSQATAFEPPAAGLRAVVVVPARDEEERDRRLP